MLKVIGSPFPGDAYDIAMLTENIAIHDLSTPGTLMHARYTRYMEYPLDMFFRYSQILRIYGLEFVPRLIFIVGFLKITLNNIIDVISKQADTS